MRAWVCDCNSGYSRTLLVYLELHRVIREPSITTSTAMSIGKLVLTLMVVGTSFLVGHRRCGRKSTLSLCLYFQAPEVGVNSYHSKTGSGSNPRPPALKVGSRTCPGSVLGIVHQCPYTQTAFLLLQHKLQKYHNVKVIQNYARHNLVSMF